MKWDDIWPCFTRVLQSFDNLNLETFEEITQLNLLSLSALDFASNECIMGYLIEKPVDDYEMINETFYLGLLAINTLLICKKALVEISRYKTKKNFGLKYKTENSIKDPLETLCDGYFRDLRTLITDPYDMEDTLRFLLMDKCGHHVNSYLERELKLHDGQLTINTKSAPKMDINLFNRILSWDHAELNYLLSHILLRDSGVADLTIRRTKYCSTRFFLDLMAFKGISYNADMAIINQEIILAEFIIMIESISGDKINLFNNTQNKTPSGEGLITTYIDYHTPVLIRKIEDFPMFYPTMVTSDLILHGVSDVMILNMLTKLNGYFNLNDMNRTKVEVMETCKRFIYNFHGAYYGFSIDKKKKHNAAVRIMNSLTGLNETLHFYVSKGAVTKEAINEKLKTIAPISFVRLDKDIKDHEEIKINRPKISAYHKVYYTIEKDVELLHISESETVLSGKSTVYEGESDYEAEVSDYDVDEITEHVIKNMEKLKDSDHAKNNSGLYQRIKKKYDSIERLINIKKNNQRLTEKDLENHFYSNFKKIDYPNKRTVTVKVKGDKTVLKKRIDPTTFVKIDSPIQYEYVNISTDFNIEKNPKYDKFVNSSRQTYIGKLEKRFFELYSDQNYYKVLDNFEYDVDCQLGKTFIQAAGMLKPTTNIKAITNGRIEKRFKQNRKAKRNRKIMLSKKSTLRGIEEHEVDTTREVFKKVIVSLTDVLENNFLYFTNVFLLKRKNNNKVNFENFRLATMEYFVLHKITKYSTNLSKDYRRLIQCFYKNLEVKIKGQIYEKGFFE